MILNDDQRPYGACYGRSDLTWFYETMPDIPNLEIARELCTECPIKADCLSSAEPDDLAFSIRGGLMPTLSLGVTPPPAKIEKPYIPRILANGICKKGLHKIESEADMYIIGRKSQCRGCRLAYETNRTAPVGPPRRERKKYCPKGHLKEGDNLYVYTRPNGIVDHMCKICKNTRHERWKSVMIAS